MAEIHSSGDNQKITKVSSPPVAAPENNVLFQRIDDLLYAHEYRRAAMLLDDLAQKKGQIKVISKSEAPAVDELQDEIAREIGGKFHAIMVTQDRHQDIYNAIRKGDYLGAAAICENLIRNNPTKTADETLVQKELRHQAEVIDAMPKTMEGMAMVFPDLRHLIDHFNLEISNSGTERINLDTLRAIHQFHTRKLFEEHKIVIEAKDPKTVQEDLYLIIKKLSTFGLRLYINKKNGDHKVYLLAPQLADIEYDHPVDLAKLQPKDLLLDGENFKPAAESGNENPKYTWVPTVVSYKPGLSITPIRRNLPAVRVADDKADELLAA